MDGLRAADCEQRICSADLILLRDKHRVLKSRFRGVGVVSAILRNLSRDLGLGIAVMTIVRSFSKAIWREYSPGRLLYPQRRAGAKGGGRFERVSWDEAIDAIAARLKAIAAEFGPEAILPYSYAGTMRVRN